MHYAGDVTYDVKGFVEKNKDSVSLDIQELLKKSQNKVISEIAKKSD